jgi:hypothetical protein
MIRDLEPIDRAYGQRLDRAANRAAYRAATAHDLQSRFIAAAFNAPDAMVPTPGSAVTQRPVSKLIADYIDDAELSLLLRDAAKGEDMQLRATLLLSVLAGRFADDQADYAMEAEGV